MRVCAQRLGDPFAKVLNTSGPFPFGVGPRDFVGTAITVVHSACRTPESTPLPF